MFLTGSQININTKTAQRVPGTTNFFFSTKLPLTIQYIFKGKMI